MRIALRILSVLALAGLLCTGCGQQDDGNGEAKQPPAPKTGARAEIETAVAKGADFLREAQNEDGGWGAKGSDVGITGLVVTGLAKAPAPIPEKNKALIDKGVKYILSKRREDGSIVNDDGQVANYRTTISARALIAVDAEKYRDTIDAAVRYTKGIQGKDPDDKAKFGSMGYGSDKTKGDIINTDFALEFLAEAGVSEDDPVYKRALVFLGRTQNLDEYAEEGIKTTNDGGAIYRAVRDVEGASKAGTIKLPDGTEVPRSYGGATYCLLKSLLFAGMKKDHPRVQAAYDWIREHYTLEEHPEMGKQGLYYFYYTMARTLELWGSPTIEAEDTEHNWAKELAAALIARQRDDGSWVNREDRWWESDPALVTAYSILTLDICDDVLNR
jgi:squalene-hopene/tetraprenyl-beta-curcumene cyclase